MPGNSDFQVKHEYFSRFEHVNVIFVRLKPRQTNHIYKWICITISTFTIIEETTSGCTECCVLEAKKMQQALFLQPQFPWKFLQHFQQTEGYEDPGPCVIDRHVLKSQFHAENRSCFDDGFNKIPSPFFPCSHSGRLAMIQSRKYNDNLYSLICIDHLGFVFSIIKRIPKLTKASTR